MQGRTASVRGHTRLVRGSAERVRGSTERVQGCTRLPANSGPATYQVTGVRSTQRGNPAQFTVNFGIEGPGIAQNTVSEIKMAA